MGLKTCCGGTVGFKLRDRRISLMVEILRSLKFDAFISTNEMETEYMFRFVCCILTEALKHDEQINVME